jgi:predicted naringenin-chalcone synthase
MKAILSALATANPRRYATQEEIYYFMESHFAMEQGERDLYRQLLLEGPIRGRYISVDEDEEMCSQDPDYLVERFARHGRRIAAQAAEAAMDQAGLDASQIEALIVNTCTGYLCPGLSSYLVEDLGLPAYTAVLDLMGMGCGGALPNLEAGCRMIQSGARKTVLCLSVEICSATFFLGPDPDLIVSNSIFSDGASAAILQADLNGDAAAGAVNPLARSLPVGASDETPHAVTTNGLLQFIDFESVTLPRYREQLRYTTQGGRLRNVLTRNVPVIGAKAVAQATKRLLERHGLTADDIQWWAVHPGGTQVLASVQKHVGLTEETLRFSYEVFRNYGNMSSPTVMFVLKKILDEANPRKNDRALLLSFGAGFTAFAALVELL